jgi:hypothetical protein
VTSTPPTDQVQEILALQLAELALFARRVREAMLQGVTPQALGFVENGLVTVLKQRGLFASPGEESPYDDHGGEPPGRRRVWSHAGRRRGITGGPPDGGPAAGGPGVDGLPHSARHAWSLLRMDRREPLPFGFLRR